MAPANPSPHQSIASSDPIRLGFKEEANAWIKWVEERCRSLKDGGGLQIMYGLHGETEIPEQELKHLRGYKDSRPVRIGNAAFSQVQLDIYGELMDTIYLANKYAEPISYDFWQVGSVGSAGASLAQVSPVLLPLNSTSSSWSTGFATTGG